MTGISCVRPLAAVALLSLIGLAQGQTSPGAPARACQIQGTSVDATHLPVVGAAIALRNILSGGIQSQKTDAAGEFCFAELAPASYSIAAEYPGLAAAGRLVELTPDGPVHGLELVLVVQGLSQEITVVSSSRVKEARDESVAVVDAISARDIRNTGEPGVAGVLGEIPGVVTRRGSTSTVAGEQVQGIDSRQVLVLVDGLPMIGARGIKSGALNLNRQPAGRLEQVEVVKGAASALYGSDAIGGVINLIPREPSAPLEADLDISAGSLSALDARGGLGFQVKNVSGFLDLERHQQQSYGLVPGSAVTVGPHYGRNDLFFRTRYAPHSRAAFSFMANAYHNREAARAIGDSGLSVSTANDSSQNYAVTGDFLLPAGATLQVRGYVGRYDENSRMTAIANPSLTGVANLNERYHRGDATLSTSLGSRQFLQAGAEWAQDLYRGANRLLGDNAGQQTTTTDVWFQDRIRLARRLTLTAGGRCQEHSSFGAYCVPKAGLTLRASDHLTLRASYGHGFRAPDLGQLAYRFANPTSFYQVLGNPNLRPETSRSMSAGATYARGRVRLGANMYRNTVRDLIDTLLLGKPMTASDLDALERQYGISPVFQPLLGRSVYLYENLSRIYTQGFELNAEANVGRGFRLRGAYTYLDARDSKTGAELTQRHRNQGFAGGEYFNPKWGFTATLRGSLYSSYLLSAATLARAYPYRIWDGYVSKRLAHGASLYAAAANLFDSTDTKLKLANPTFDRPDYGRTLRIGLRYSFGGEGR